MAACLPLLGIFPGASALHAQANDPLIRDSFRVGTGGGALCQAQSRADDPAAPGMFDRSWAVVCRDAAKSIGQVYALRNAGDPVTQLAEARGEKIECSASGSATLPDIGAVQLRNCRTANGIAYRIASIKQGRFTYFAQGYDSYSSAMDLALRTVITGKIAQGDVNIASLGTVDATGFARLQAATLDPQTTLAEGYRRNNSGNYAEAAEFFDTLQDRLGETSYGQRLSEAERQNRLHEYVVNRALQLSNLGQFDQANALFVQAAGIPVSDRVQTRLARNFEAMHKLNQRDYAAAIAVLDRPLMSLEDAMAVSEGAVELTPTVAGEINSASVTSFNSSLQQDSRLTPDERASIIDAQAEQLRGTILRLQGKPAEARAALDKAMASAIAIRDGRVTSITRLRAQILAETALTYEAEGDLAKAEGLLSDAVQLLAVQYPETVALNGARARKAAFLVRHDRDADALSLYREIVTSTQTNRASLTGLANQLAPYFELLAKQIPAQPDLVNDMFAASQLLVRPGAADTLEVLTRELSAGTSDGSRLFRQSVSLGRDIERARIQLAQLEQQAQQDASVLPAIEAQKKDIAALSQQQAETLTALAAFPQYSAVSREALSLADLRSVLQPGEAYMKLAVVGGAVYAIYADAQGATGYRTGVSAKDLDSQVGELRETISTVENGSQVTYAFDVDIARQLFVELFTPIQDRLPAAKHLIFEPDGGMLKLPPNLLIMDQASVDAYKARTADGKGDEFDFRGIDWLGRDRAVSTALSARGFRDARRTPPSPAKQEYIGFGQNQPIGPVRKAAFTRSVTASGETGVGCDWPVSEWNKPIAADELNRAASLLRSGGAQVVTGAAFTDDGILARTDLSDYRILHFATHGLVTAPRPGCPARPALLTSFGGPRSDGLLQFSEIFDLKLNADLVILSACDTAGQATREATRAAGLGVGGGSALDGLVRAFIGAGGRAVIASHWPAPDEFNATQRLISGLFEAPQGEAMGDALHKAQLVLMDDVNTSHPFYWSGFAIVGDGARPLLTKTP